MAKVSREEIIEAAIHLFNQNGYHATSMQDIAKAVCIKKPSLYHHFDSKEAILLTILDTGMEWLINEVDSIANSEKDCVEKLRAAVHAHASMIARNPEGAAVFLREDRGLGDDYLTQYVSRRDHFERVVRNIVQQGIDEGVFRMTDTTISVHALLGTVNWMTRWYRTDGRLRPDQIADHFADLFLLGLLKKP
jgi:TetR/AcrR family transcriptional regulator, cholesterol catabolism regulator